MNDQIMTKCMSINNKTIMDKALKLDEQLTGGVNTVICVPLPGSLVASGV